ncbi:hypothetical protein V494_03599 [Pseudogymnoascus sp. VKM F-4513 (FW-928)]|nr:hypothetical protein V494_03599 [Pseudogymnoascus sp. VKM F-4513 (FW-928)]
MFGLQRQKVLDESLWEPRDQLLAYTDTWSYPGSQIATHDCYRQGFLADAEVNEWLYQRGRFTQPNHAHLGKSNGAIRLLICERLGWRPLGFAMSDKSFLALEKAFGLPTGTLPLLGQNRGEHSCQFKLSATNSVESVAIMLKVPQKYQLGNYGLALSHSFETGITVAFLHGWGVLTGTNHVTGEKMIPHAERIQGLIKSAISLWTHPLLLPVILLEEHLFRADEFKSHVLSRNATSIEYRLGVTQSGRLTSSRNSFGLAELRELVGNEEARIETTTLLSTTMTDTINLIASLKWDHRYCKFLQSVCSQIQELQVPRLACSERELNASIDTLECITASHSDHAVSIKERLDLQLSVLYNFVAQADSSLNFRMAATTGLDSSAMKTLAFVTVVFLPPTFVATLFSMSMFNWQASSNNNSSESAIDNGRQKVVVTDLWIYWVVSVPLTLMVLLGWRVWWHYQKIYYTRRYPHATEEQVSLDK